MKTTVACSLEGQGVPCWPRRACLQVPSQFSMDRPSTQSGRYQQNSLPVSSARSMMTACMLLVSGVISEVGETLFSFSDMELLSTSSQLAKARNSDPPLPSPPAASLSWSLSETDDCPYRAWAHACQLQPPPSFVAFLFFSPAAQPGGPPFRLDGNPGCCTTPVRGRSGCPDHSAGREPWQMQSLLISPVS